MPHTLPHAPCMLSTPRCVRYPLARPMAITCSPSKSMGVDIAWALADALSLFSLILLAVYKLKCKQDRTGTYDGDRWLEMSSLRGRSCCQNSLLSLCTLDMEMLTQPSEHVCHTRRVANHQHCRHASSDPGVLYSTTLIEAWATMFGSVERLNWAHLTYRWGRNHYILNSGELLRCM